MAVHIVYIFDERYSIYSSISAISAIKFAKEKLIFHCIGPKESATGFENFTTNYPHMARRCTFTLVIQTMVVLRLFVGKKQII